MRGALLLMLWPALAAAETPLTGAEFQAHVGMNTFSFLYSTGARGTADYGPDRTLVWAFEGDRCITGQWFEVDREICFVYPAASLSACWHFFLDDNRLRGVATRMADDVQVAQEIVEMSHTDKPLGCAGPDAGA